METSIGTNNWSMVDHMVGGVGGNMLLDSDLGNMVDLVVDLNSNLMDNRGSGNSNWGSMDNWGSVNGNWGSVNSNWGSVGNSNRGSMSNGKGSSSSYSNRCCFSRY